MDTDDAGAVVAAARTKLPSTHLGKPRVTVLFTTVVFVGIYLPIALVGFFSIARFSHAAAALWLFVASVFFYGYWMPEFTLLLLASISANFLIGTRISALTATASRLKSKRWLILGITLNLILLAYFKYANFFIDNLNAAVGSNWNIGRVILPIGISFFTFTQIAFLADTWQRGVKEYKFVHYGLFVSYFPHLIAGPVLHHAQMMPQFKDAATYRFNQANFIGGLAIFAIGLFKKVVLADGISPYADAVFSAADAGASPDILEAWLGALAYTFQLYFDFSGYSDMAVGLSWMFNVRLPFNFNSPYKATNISEFWRRWHMTLSHFLRDYLYIALGGNRNGGLRRYVNLMTTMVLGGLWHGASWSFVLWGCLHGLYLVLNHGFRAMLDKSTRIKLEKNRVYALTSWTLTMLAVILAWVFFRAETLPGAGRMLLSMITLDTLAPSHVVLWNEGLMLAQGWIWCAGLSLFAFLAPNSNFIGERALDICRKSRSVRFFVCGFALSAVAFLLLLNVTRDSVSAFIYFNF